MNSATLAPSRRHRRPSVRIVGALVALVLAVAACSGDDGADVRSDGTASASGAGSGSGSGSASGTEEAQCNPVGPEREDAAEQTVEIELTNYAFAPDVVEVEPGVVTFVATNSGDENHELAFLPGGGEVPMTDQGMPDEDALAEAGAFELEAFGAGQTCKATYDLEPGTYTMFCIVETPEGMTHLAEGMKGTLTVTKA